MAWRALAMTGDASGELAAVAVAEDGRGVAVGSSEDGAIVATSPDGKAWTLRTDDPAFDGANLTSAVAIDEGFIVAGVHQDRAAVWISTRGGEWRRVALPPPDTGIGSVAAMAGDGERVVAVGSGAWVSDDGEKWTLAGTVPVEAAAGALPGRLSFSPVGCGGSLVTVEATEREFVAAGSVGCAGRTTIWRSPDGEAWESEEPDAFGEATVNDVAAVEGRPVAFGSARGAAAAWTLTEDGWKPFEGFEAPGARMVDAVTALPGGYAAVIDGAAWRSSNGATWRPAATDGTGFPRDVAAAGDRAVAVGVDDGRPALWLSPPDPAGSLSAPRVAEIPEVAGRWSARSPLPVPGYVSAVTGPDGLIYVFGAATTDGGAIVQVMQVYDAAADRWQVMPVGAGPSAGPPAAVARGERIILIQQGADGASAVHYDSTTASTAPIVAALPGFVPTRAVSVTGGALVAGFDEEAVEPALWLLRDGEANWARLATPPGAVDGLVGSGSTAYALIASRMWRYEVGADTWAPLARKPTPRAEFSMLQDRDGLIWVLGGFTQEGPDALVEAYDPAADVWLRGPDLPTPRMYPAGTVTPDGSLVLLGGSTRGGSEPGGVVEVLQP